jgi:hypothetical protein
MTQKDLIKLYEIADKLGKTDRWYRRTFILQEENNIESY